jgi:hypothetical protein
MMRMTFGFDSAAFTNEAQSRMSKERVFMVLMNGSRELLDG